MNKGMAKYSELDKKKLRGNLTNISKLVGCSSKYVYLVVYGKVTRDTKTTKYTYLLEHQFIQVLSLESVSDFT